MRTEKQPIRILTLNIEGDKHLSAVLSLLEREKSDVVCLQELFVEDYEFFRNAFAMNGYVLATVDIDIAGKPRFGKRGPMGIGILTREHAEFGCAYYHRKRGATLPRYGGRPNSGHRALVWCDVQTQHKLLRVATTHFTWSRRGRTTVKQLADLASLMKVLDWMKPDFFCGDFNAPRGGAIYASLASRFIDCIPRVVRSTLDPVHHYRENLDLVVDGFFSGSRCRVTDVRLIGDVSDHKAIVGTVSMVNRHEGDKAPTHAP